MLLTTVHHLKPMNCLFLDFYGKYFISELAMCTKTVGSENLDEGVILDYGGLWSSISPLRFTVAEAFLWVFFLDELLQFCLRCGMSLFTGKGSV